MQETKDVRAKIGHRSRAGDLHRVHLKEGERLLDEDDAEQEVSAVQHGGRVLRERALVDHRAHDERAHEGHGRGHEQKEERDVELGRVRTNERPQPPEQARVVRLDDVGLFVERAQHLVGAAHFLRRLARRPPERRSFDLRRHAAPAGAGTTLSSFTISPSSRCSSAKRA